MNHLSRRDVALLYLLSAPVSSYIRILSLRHVAFIAELNSLTKPLTTIHAVPRGLSLPSRLISRELFNFQGLAAARSLSVESSLIVLASDQVLREGGGRDNEWRFSGNFEARLQ